MEENFKSKLGFMVFIILILFLAIGGFFFTKKAINSDKETQKNNDAISYKIDNEKDYIYFINEDTISEEADLFYKDVVINLSTQKELTENLKKENNIYKDTVQYITDNDILNNEVIPYNHDNLYALTNRTYETYEYDHYISLVIKDFDYSCFDLLTFSKTKGYVFDIKTGNIVSEEDLLNKFNTNMEDIKVKIREDLENSQTVENDVELIKIDETLSDFTNYALYINDYGNLAITYLVKSSEVDYNLSMEVS